MRLFAFSERCGWPGRAGFRTFRRSILQMFCDTLPRDRLRRRTKTIEKYDDGNPTTGADDKYVTVEFTFNTDGNLATIMAKNGHTGDETTTYVYGTNIGGITAEV